MMEESIRDIGTKTKRIEYLTDFLISEHYKKIGIYKTDHDSLFHFWRDHISVYKRELVPPKKAQSLYPQANYEQDSAALIHKP